MIKTIIVLTALVNGQLKEPIEFPTMAECVAVRDEITTYAAKEGETGVVVGCAEVKIVNTASGKELTF